MIKKRKYIFFKLLINEKIELGIEIKNKSLEEVCSFVAPQYNFFFNEFETNYNCNISKLAAENNEIVFIVKNLNENFYSDILFKLKNKLETMFETERLYFRILEDT